jgi:acyl-coenzyme A synthetase/AMP-(fatty) acid ligase
MHPSMRAARQGATVTPTTVSLISATMTAVVQPVDLDRGGPELAAELIEWCRERLSHYKCPRTVDFDADLPRAATGKLYKKQVRDRYWIPSVS